jgi:type I restriction enzyme S subunit
MSSKKKITVTKGDDKPVLVPKLRFSGFDKPWSNDPLSKTLKEHKIKNTDGREVFSVSMEYGIVNQIELLGRSYAAADTSNYTVGRRFDVVYTKSPLKAFPFGIVKQCKFDGEVALSPLYGVFTPPNPYVGLMIEAYFEAPNRSKDFLAPLCQKGAKNTLQITNATFLSGSLPLPTQPTEQKKIAECLSSVDELIAAQARKLDALKTHKKGLMQQLFPREGETQPRLRFLEFQNAGDWVLQRLDELAHYENGKAHENNITENGRYIVVNSKFISTEGEVRKFSNEGFCVADEGDVLMVLSDVPNGRAIAKCFFVESDELYTVNQRICRIEPTKVNGKFLFYVLDRNSYFLNFDDGIKQTNLRKEDVVGFPLCAPTQHAEQKRIAECLTSLDDLIAANTQKLEALKTHKKGLMQQLFPSTEEVDA